MRGRPSGSKDSYQRTRKKKSANSSGTGKQFPTSITLKDFFPQNDNDRRPPQLSRHAILRDQLAKQGFQVKNVENKGDCLPMTIAEEIFHHINLHEKCRRSMIGFNYRKRHTFLSDQFDSGNHEHDAAAESIRWMVAELQLPTNFVANIPSTILPEQKAAYTYFSYLKKALKPQCWLGEHELIAALQMFGVAAVVFTERRGGDETEILTKYYGGDGAADRRIYEEQQEDQEGDHIRLAFWDHLHHYEPVLKMVDGEMKHSLETPLDQSILNPFLAAADELENCTFEQFMEAADEGNQMNDGGREEADKEQDTQHKLRSELDDRTSDEEGEQEAEDKLCSELEDEMSEEEGQQEAEHKLRSELDDGASDEEGEQKAEHKLCSELEDEPSEEEGEQEAEHKLRSELDGGTSDEEGELEAEHDLGIELDDGRNEEAVQNRGCTDYGHYHHLYILELQRMTKFSQTPLYDDYVSIDDYDDTGEVFGRVCPHVPSDDDDDNENSTTVDDDCILDSLDEDGEEAAIYQEVLATTEDMPLDDGDMNILVEEFFEEALETGGVAAETPSAVNLGQDTNLGSSWIDPLSLSDAEKHLLPTVLRSSVKPRKGTLNNSLFVKTWNAIASASTNIRAFTSSLFSNFWKVNGDRLRTKLSYQPLKSRDGLLAQHLRGPHRNGCTFPELIANNRPPLKRAAVPEFSQQLPNSCPSISSVDNSCDSLDGPLPSRHDASQVPSQKEAEGSDGDSGCGFTPSSPLHDSAFSAATSPPPSKKIRKPRSCKTCGHELSAKLAVGASGYTHEWDASARKFAPCECPAEFYHPSISRRRKKNRKHLCSTCKNPIYGTNFREYHIDISTNKRIKCTFFDGHSPGAEELC